MTALRVLVLLVGALLLAGTAGCGAEPAAEEIGSWDNNHSHSHGALTHSHPHTGPHGHKGLKQGEVAHYTPARLAVTPEAVAP